MAEEVVAGRPTLRENPMVVSRPAISTVSEGRDESPMRTLGNNGITLDADGDSQEWTIVVEDEGLRDAAVGPIRKSGGTECVVQHEVAYAVGRFVSCDCSLGVGKEYVGGGEGAYFAFCDELGEGKSVYFEF